jgi:hypothetical protein
MVLYIIFYSLDKEYQLVSKYENKSNKQFRKIINFSSVTSVLLCLLIVPAFERYIHLIRLDVDYAQAVCSIPFLLRSYLRQKIAQKNSLLKENSKKKDIVLTYCYYCGSELNGSNICPGCGKKLDL